jgi:DNA-binding NarL/FixJ family response regulator
MSITLVCPACLARWKIVDGPDRDEPAVCPNCAPKVERRARVLALRAEGLTWKQVGRELGLSWATARNIAREHRALDGHGG